MLFASKLITSSGNIILNICDTELLDKIIKDEKTEIKISSNYYNEKTISLSLKLGVGSEAGVRRIDGIPFLLIFKM